MHLRVLRRHNLRAGQPEFRLRSGRRRVHLVQRRISVRRRRRVHLRRRFVRERLLRRRIRRAVRNVRPTKPRLLRPGRRDVFGVRDRRRLRERRVHLRHDYLHRLLPGFSPRMQPGRNLGQRLRHGRRAVSGLQRGQPLRRRRMRLRQHDVQFGLLRRGVVRAGQYQFAMRRGRRPLRLVRQRIRMSKWRLRMQRDLVRRRLLRVAARTVRGL